METCIKYDILRLIDDHKNEMTENDYIRMCNYMKYIHELEKHAQKSNRSRNYIIISGPRSDSSHEHDQRPTIYDFLRK